MGKTVSYIIGAALIVAGIVTANPYLIAQGGLIILSTALAPGAPRLEPPETASTAIKTSTPPRTSGYGRGRLFGAYVLFANTDFSVNSDSFAPYAVDVFAVHDGPIDGIEIRYLGDDVITLTGSSVDFLDNNQYGGSLVHWYETLGATPGTANFAAIISLLPGEWTSAHRGDGVVCIGVTWKPVSPDEFNERFPQGAAPASIVARWQKCFDPRDGGQDPDDPATWEWTENAVLHLLHYRLVREKARRTSGAALPDGTALLDAWNLFFEPTRSYWEDAADICDEAVALKAGGTEARYRSSFQHKHTDPHKDVIAALTSCFDGWTSPRSDGALVVYAGKYYDPTVSIGPDQIVNYSWQYGVVDEEAVNELKLTYKSALHDYNTVDTDSWVDSDDMLERGAVRTQGLDFQVPSHSQTRRLAKRYMARIMAANRGTVTTNAAGRIVRGERYINLQIIEAGAEFFNGVVEITSLTRNMATGGVTFTWVEITENIDAWNPATEEGDPAPVATSVTLIAPPAPTIDSAVVIYDSPGTGTTGARVLISLSGPSGEDLTWFARWRVEGDPIWNEQRYTDVDSSATIELITDFVPVDEDLEVEAAYMSGTGALSRWSFPATDVTTDSETVAPDAAAIPTLVQWTNSLDMMVAPIPRASTYRWRIYESDGTTLIRTIVTASPAMSYDRALAASDGVQRDYVIDVAGVNGAGAGTAGVSAALSKPAPAAVTGFSVADDAYTASAVFTPSADPDVSGYIFSFSRTSGFNPLTAGFSKTGTGSPIFYYNLAADTYYGKVAPFDVWSSNPSLLNYTAEDTFAITTGGGTSTGDAPGGGGGGGTGGTGDGWDTAHQ